MKFRLSNLGIVKGAEIKVNDLTIIAGPNNSGKTYITYSIYGFLKDWKRGISFNKINQYVDQIISNGSIRIPLKELQAARIEVEDSLSKNYSKHITNIFNDKEELLSKAKFQIIDINKKNLNSNPISVRIGDSIELKGHCEEDFFSITLVSNNEIQLPPKIIIRDILNRILGEFLYANNISRPFIFTSERLGISLFYKELDIAKSALVGELQRLDKENGNFNPISFLEKLSSWYAIPIKDDIEFTRRIQKVQKNKLLQENKLLIGQLKKMIGGYYKHVGNEIRFISTSRKDNKFDIPLYLASSSARGFASLFFFLGYVAKEGMILMVDEPEGHLSLANQVEMAKLLALCVNQGIKVFLTTHSDFLIKEFNNLIMLNSLISSKGDFIEKNKNYSINMALNPKKVSAYLCSEGVLKECKIDKYGADIPIFDNSIDSINRISDELEFYLDSRNAN